MPSSLILTFPSHQQSRGVYLAALQFCPRVRAVPGLECPEAKKTKVNKKKPWHPIKGRDIILLGKQCLIVIMICGSARSPTCWATQWGGGAAEAPDSPQAESWLVIWPEDVVNLQVKCKRSDGGAPENLPCIQRSRGRLLSSAVAKWCSQSSVPVRLQLPLEIKVGRG